MKQPTERGAKHLRESILRTVSREEAAHFGSVESSCNVIVRSGQAASIVVEKLRDIVRIKKVGPDGLSHSDDFSLTVRLVEARKGVEWWPIEWSPREGQRLRAEVEVSGKRMTNLSVQNELIEIANNWGKSIAAQKTAKDLGNAG